MSAPYTKKLIEVSIPLKEINEACAREKSIRHGHPSTLHLWWARRPLAAARSVLFCQLVDDPSGYVEELVKDKMRAKATEQELLMEPEGEKDLSPRLRERLIEKERERLHDLVKELVIWENTTNEHVLNQARREIKKTWARQCRRDGKPEDTPMPPVLDPFAGGGAIPLEAQRLGMEAHASDLNPVAVLINKAMIEIPPKFAGLPPVNPEWQGKTKEEKAATTWTGAQGLAEDVRYYGNWMREQAKQRIGHLYPPYTLTQELLDGRPDLVKSGYKAGDELTVIAWLWARTVPSPNPALNGKHVPLVSSFWLSKKKGKEAYVEPIIEGGEYRFEVRVGIPQNSKSVSAGTKVGRGNFTCLLSGIPIPAVTIRESGKKSDLGSKILALVCEGRSGRIYLSGDEEAEIIARSAKPAWKPDQALPKAALGFRIQNYGLKLWSDLFTDRQLLSLTTFSDLVHEAQKLIERDTASMHSVKLDTISLEETGKGSRAYSDSVTVYLGLAQSRLSDFSSMICGWNVKRDGLRSTFGRHAIPMTWDFAEVNCFSSSSGNFAGLLGAICKVLRALPAKGESSVQQLDSSSRNIESGTIISSDPPYYDNIGYADLSDFFYVWLRKSLKSVLSRHFAGILVPKTEELIASPDRHGTKAKAESFFLSGMTSVASRWASSSGKLYPIAIYYAFKQAEIKSEGLVSTGWATFLGAMLEANLAVVGTWPLRTERPGRVREIGSAALATSIVLVCRQRPADAETITKREFIELMETELPPALAELQHANLTPVDLPQSAIGPGMAIYSRHAAVIKGDGEAMSVTEALQLINHELSGILDGQVLDMDEETRFACRWFDQNAFSIGSYGDAETIANGINVSVESVVAAGILESGKGKVRILKPEELPADWDPETDDNCTVWEVVHHLIRLAETAGDTDCARIIARLPHSRASEARQLCYRLFTTSDQNGWSKEAQAYNQLISNWTTYTDLASNLPKQEAPPTQSSLDL